MCLKEGDSYRQTCSQSIKETKPCFSSVQKLFSISNTLELLRMYPGYEPVRKQGCPLVSR